MFNYLFAVDRIEKYKKLIKASSSKLSLEEFINSPIKNAYIQYKTIKAYVHLDPKKSIDNKIYEKVLVVANIVNTKRATNVEFNAKKKSTGLYREFDNYCKEMAKKYGFSGVYVESVFNQFLGKKLEEYGYIKCNENYGSDNYLFDLGKEKIEAAQFTKPVLLYHGTSSKFLKSILKHGLLPNTKEGRWLSDNDANENNRSRASYGGIYFTNNLGTATSAATNLIIHTEGSWSDRTSDPIIVCAEIQPASTIGDEDDYEFRLFNGQSIPQTMIPSILALLRAKIKYKGYYNKETRDYINENVKALIDKFVGSSYNLRQDKAKLYSLAQEVLLTELERQIAYKSVRSGTKYWYSYEKEAKQTVDGMNYHKGGLPYGEPLPKAMRPQSKEKAEQRAKQALDLFIKATKTYSKQNLEEGRGSQYPRGTTRILSPVTFRGSNKITCIIELKENSIILHYGKIPGELKRQYEQTKGPWPKVMNTSGEKIESSLGEVYHYTSINNLKSILEDKAFKLSTSIGTRSDQTSKNNPFFLSLTRSKVGGYHTRSVGNNGVILALNADYLQHNNKMSPIDYWGPVYRAVDQKMNEMEEKFTSKNQLLKLPNPPTRLIHSIHILIKPNDSLNEPRWNYITRRALLECKKLKIPVFVYNNTKDWITQRSQRSIPLNSIKDQLIGPEPERETQWSRTNFLEPWVELYLKPFNKKEQLSLQAKSKLRYINSEYRLQEAITQLSSDIHNDRSKSNVASLVKLITKSGSIKQYLYDLHNKWFPEDILKIESSINDSISLHKEGETEVIENPMIKETNYTYKYVIHKNNKPINAKLTAIISDKEPDRAYLIIDGDEKHTLGPVGMRKVFHEITKQLPQIKQFYGKRVTGAKKKWSKEDRDIAYNVTKPSTNKVEAANRAFSAIHINELPVEYRKQKPLGRGATSIVYPNDDDTVIMFTRDEIKLDWMRENGVMVDFNTYQPVYTNNKFRELPIYKCIVKKLYPLNKTNKLIIGKILDYFNTTKPGTRYNPYYKTYSNANHHRSVYLNNLIEQLEERMSSVEARKHITEIVNFLMNYDESQYAFDLGPKQFLQTKDGELVLNDPVVSKELLDTYRSK